MVPRIATLSNNCREKMLVVFLLGVHGRLVDLGVFEGYALYYNQSLVTSYNLPGHYMGERAST